jgi:hypothetical protein
LYRFALLLAEMRKGATHRRLQSPLGRKIEKLIHHEQQFPSLKSAAFCKSFRLQSKNSFGTMCLRVNRCSNLYNCLRKAYI